MRNKVITTVVTFNRKLLLKECIEALLTNPTDILIIDNASTDGTYDFIQELIDDDKVKYVNTGENLGGAGGFNFALKSVANSNYEYILLMDDDTIVQENTVQAFLEASSDLGNNFGFLSSFAEFTDGTACKMNIQDVSKDWINGIEKNPYLTKIDKATFVSFFIKREILSEVGYPIKDFFIWADDSEFSRRISKLYPSYLVANSRITHKMVANGDANYRIFLTEELPRANRYYYSFRNRFFIAKREGFTESLKYAIKLLAILGIVLVKAENNRVKKAGILLKGFWDGVFFNPKIEHVEA